MKTPISLVLVTDAICNLSCKSCPAGRKESQPSKQMSVEMAERIIKKACDEARVLSVCLYYFNEPLLHPNIVELVKLCHKYKKKSLLSTNLVRWKNVEEVMAEEPFNVIISLSGFTQSVYERYHKNGDIEKVKEHLVKLKSIRKPKTAIQVSYHRFAYNLHELPLMEKFVKDLGDGFRFVPYGVGLLPLENVEARWNHLAPFTDAESDLSVRLEDAKKLCGERKHWDCDLQAQTLTVNGEGLVYNCGTRNNKENLRPSFFDSSVNEIMAARKQDATCIKCKAQGLHIYGMQAYTIPVHSPTHKIIELYKRTKLQGLIPGLTKLGIRMSKLYMRP